jgi:hypothetical protein
MIQHVASTARKIEGERKTKADAEAVGRGAADAQVLVDAEGSKHQPSPETKIWLDALERDAGRYRTADHALSV